MRSWIATWVGGLIDADPTVVGIVIGVVMSIALLYVVSRVRARRSEGD